MNKILANNNYAKNRFWRLILWRIDAKADRHTQNHFILVVKILAFRVKSAKFTKILSTKISRCMVYSTLPLNQSAISPSFSSKFSNLFFASGLVKMSAIMCSVGQY